MSFADSIAKGEGSIRLRYHFKGENPDLIDGLNHALPGIIAHIEESLGERITTVVDVVLTLTPEEFAQATRGSVPQWAGGVAYPDRMMIVLKAPLFFGQGVPLHVLATHELAHLYVHKATNGNYLPRWLNEGVAMLLAGETRQGTLTQLSNAAARNRLMGLPRVDYVLGFSRPDAALAYAEARSAAQLFLDQFGWAGVRQLFTEVKEGRDFEEAFLSATGVEYAYWQVEWLDYARERYRNAVLLQIDQLIWIFIVLLGAIAVITVYIKRRIQFRRWMEEEDDDLDDYGGPITPG